MAGMAFFLAFLPSFLQTFRPGLQAQTSPSGQAQSSIRQCWVPGQARGSGELAHFGRLSISNVSRLLPCAHGILSPLLYTPACCVPAARALLPSSLPFPARCTFMPAFCYTSSFCCLHMAHLLSPCSHTACHTTTVLLHTCPCPAAALPLSPLLCCLFCLSPACVPCACHSSSHAAVFTLPFPSYYNLL